MQVGAVDQVITLTVLLEQFLTTIDPAQRATVSPMAHALIFRVIRLVLQCVVQTEMVECVCGCRAQRQTGTHLGQVRRLLVNGDPKPLSLKGECRCQTADAAADDAYGGVGIHGCYFA